MLLAMLPLQMRPVNKRVGSLSLSAFQNILNEIKSKALNESTLIRTDEDKTLLTRHVPVTTNKSLYPVNQQPNKKCFH